MCGDNIKPGGSSVTWLRIRVSPPGESVLVPTPGSAPERYFESMLCLPQLPDGPDHPMHSQRARRGIARHALDDLWRRRDQIQAEGRWTPAMAAALRRMEDVAESDNDAVMESLIAFARPINAVIPPNEHYRV
jgi:hypothetical protein